MGILFLQLVLICLNKPWAIIKKLSVEMEVTI